MPIRPLVFRVPERTIIERTFVERPVERHTDKLPALGPTPAPHVTVVLPPTERSTDARIRKQAETDDDQRLPPLLARTDGPEKSVVGTVPELVPNKKPIAEDAPKPLEPEQKTFDTPNKKSSGEEQKTIPPDNENNSPNNSVPIVPELFEPDTSAPQGDAEEFEKIGPGRQRRYEELGEKDIEPIRELVLFRNEFGRHWPGLSKDMEAYYERFYFTPPNKRKDGKDFAKHTKCWERRTKWLAATEPATGSH